jgi:methylenetetrahydrofolate reductase (NADPH)
VKFDDEPAPGENLPILPGHTSPGRFERVLRAGQFAVTAEIAPPDSADPADVYERAALFDGYVDAINATDSSGANCHMSSMGICSLLTRRGYAMILQQSCRDRNRIAMQGDILGAAAMGVCNVLCLSGDGVQSGDHPEAKPVFDMDSISALSMVRYMRDEQQFLSGRAIKIAAGAQFIQTQYCFDVERMKTFMAQVRDMGLLEKAYVLAGVGPLASAKAAEWIRKNVAGVHIPDDVIQRLAGAEDQKQEGVDLCVDLIEQVREIEGVSGVHIMAYRMEDRIGEIVARSNALSGREPWRPAP